MMGHAAVSRAACRASPNSATLVSARRPARMPFPWLSYSRPTDKRYATTDALPTTFQPGFWRSMLPRFLRSTPQTNAVPTKPKSKEWNPMTFFIVIFMLIGSQGIQTIVLQREFDQFSNQTEAKLSLLREVVYRVKNGEDMDVEGLLGTGDAQKEKEWEAVIEELAQEDSRLELTRRQRKDRRNKQNSADAPSDSSKEP